MNLSCFSVVTYNVHSCVGTDGLFDESRVAGVIESMKADVVGLQEVAFSGSRRNGFRNAFPRIIMGNRVIPGPTLLKDSGLFGNVLLTRHRVLEIRREDITVIPYEPRGVIDAGLEVKGRHVRVLVTHLGLRPGERRIQVRKLMRILESGSKEFVVLVGDLNECFPFRSVRRRLESWFGDSPSPRTFPARKPLFSLDRIFVRPVSALLRVEAFRSEEARSASDHLPLKAVVEMER